MNSDSYHLTRTQQLVWIAISFFLVAFGQPAWIALFGLLAAAIGYGLFWRVLLSLSEGKARFWLGMGWYTAIQIVQLSWFTAHPFLYIYVVLFLLASLMGIQFGLLALFIRPKTIFHLPKLFGLASFWVLMEWMRLFFFSGLSLNPTGLALTGFLYPLQFASLGGIYFLSWWIIITNLLALRAWKSRYQLIPMLTWALVAIVPYCYGFIHLHWHDREMKNFTDQKLSVLLVQPAFPMEENLSFNSIEEARQFVLDEWKEIFHLLHSAKIGQVPLDLIVFPEYVVPYGTFDLIYPFKSAQEELQKFWGMDQVNQAIHLIGQPLEGYGFSKSGPLKMATNGFFAQAIANIAQADVVIGLEDSIHDHAYKKIESFSSAFYFQPGNSSPKRYDKRVLLPMGEYIPFEFCRALAAKYGISGSFTPGQQAQLFGGSIPFGPTICYEETFGHLMRDNRLIGAELLVNSTNDGWYPNSRLAKQHFDHARLRTVELGVPLVRACNTGISGAIDSLGRVIGVIDWGKEDAGVIRLDVPLYHYRTLYTIWGDYFVLSLSCVSIIFVLINYFRK